MPDESHQLFWLSPYIFFGCAKHTAFTAAVCPSRDRKHPVLNQGSTHQNN